MWTNFLLRINALASMFKENNIIRAAYAFEQSRDYERCEVAKNRD